MSKRVPACLWVCLVGGICLALVAGLPGAPTVLGASPAQVTPTPTSGPTDILMTGRVYDASIGPSQGIAGAVVSTLSCFPRSYAAVTQVDGSYSLFLPGSYFACGNVPVTVSAVGYQTLAMSFSVAML